MMIRACLGLLQPGTHSNFQYFIFTRVQASHFAVNPDQRSGVKIQGFLHSCMQVARDTF